MEKIEIAKILEWYNSGTLKTDEAVERIFSLFSVVQQSEQFICHSCNEKKSGQNDDQLHEVCKDCFGSI